MNEPSIPDKDLNDTARRSREKGLSFRSISDDDLPFLREVYGSTRAEELKLAPWSESQKKTFIEQQFDAQHLHYQKHYPDALWLVIEHSGHAIGRLYLERWESEHRLIDIALLPAFRNTGLGTIIMRDLMDEAAQVDKILSIHVEKHNPAMHLYRRLGFKMIEDKGVHELMHWRSADQLKIDS